MQLNRFLPSMLRTSPSLLRMHHGHPLSRSCSLLNPHISWILTVEWYSNRVVHVRYMSAYTDVHINSQKTCHCCILDGFTVLLCIWKVIISSGITRRYLSSEDHGLHDGFSRLWTSGTFCSQETEQHVLQNPIINMQQDWHSDGDHQSEREHLPPYAVNIFVPLVDIFDKKKGPTE